MMSANECEAYAEALSDLADGEIAGVEAARVEAHVAECSSCRVELKLLRGVVMSLTRVPEEEVPTVLAMRVMDRVRQPSLVDRIIAVLAAPFSPSGLRVSLSAAALVFMVFAGRALVQTESLKPAPGDQFA